MTGGTPTSFPGSWERKEPGNEVGGTLSKVAEHVYRRLLHIRLTLSWAHKHVLRTAGQSRVFKCLNFCLQQLLVARSIVFSIL